MGRGGYIPAGIYLLKVNNRNNRTRRQIYSKLTIKTPERRQWRRSTVFIVNFEYILHLALVFTVKFEHVIAGWDKSTTLKYDFIFQSPRAVIKMFSRKKI